MTAETYEYIREDELRIQDTRTIYVCECYEDGKREPAWDYNFRDEEDAKACLEWLNTPQYEGWEFVFKLVEKEISAEEYEDTNFAYQYIEGIWG